MLAMFMQLNNGQAVQCDYEPACTALKYTVVQEDDASNKLTSKAIYEMLLQLVVSQLL